MLPATDDRLLPPTAGAYSRDAYLYSGTIIGWRKPKVLKNLVSASTRMAFRVPAALSATDITDTSYWLEFTDVNTHVIRTPVIEDTFQRYYFASPSVVPKYNVISRIAVGASAWLLGVPTPTVAPIVTPAGSAGLGLATARAYVYTWLSAYGEESAPSPPLVVDGFLDDVWSVTATAPASSDQGVNRNLTSWRLYRTVTDTNGISTYFLVVEKTIASGMSYSDTLKDDIVAENNILESTTWAPPPSDLAGFISAANGMTVGWKNNEIWFSEPFRPHAWPSIYTVTTDFPIVGMGALGQSIVVATTGFPVVLTGSNPSTMTDNVIRRSEPCTCHGSIVAAPDAVYYTSPNGLIAITPYGSLRNTTDSWIRREQWHTYAPLVSNRAIMHGPFYFALGSVYVDPRTGLDNGSQAQVGFSINSPQTASQEVQGPTQTISNPALGLLTAPDGYDVYNVQSDYWTAVPFLIQNQQVRYYDYTDAAPAVMAYKWKSKIFQANAKHNFAAMKVWFNVPAGTTAQNSTRTVTDTIPTLANDMYGIVRVYVGDGVPTGSSGTPMTLHTTREIRNSGELLRIRSGQLYEYWEWELEARVEILSLQTATSVKELGGL